MEAHRRPYIEEIVVLKGAPLHFHVTLEECRGFLLRKFSWVQDGVCSVARLKMILQSHQRLLVLGHESMGSV